MEYVAKIILMILFFITTACTNAYNLNKSATISQGAIKECSAILKNSNLCQEVVDRKTKEYEAKYIRIHMENSKNKLINSTNQSKTKLQVHDLNALSSKSLNDIKNAPKMIGKMEPINSKWICEFGFEKGIECIKVSDILAVSENKLAASISRELLLLEKKYEVKPGDILLNCGYGQWATFASFSDSEPYESNKEKKLTFLCAEKIQSLRDDYSNRFPQGNLSPGTTYSPFSVGEDLCNLGANSIKSLGSFVASTINTIEQVRNACFGGDINPLSNAPYAGTNENTPIPALVQPPDASTYDKRMEQFEFKSGAIKESVTSLTEGFNIEGDPFQTFSSPEGMLTETSDNQSGNLIRSELFYSDTNNNSVTQVVDHKNNTITTTTVNSTNNTTHTEGVSRDGSSFTQDFGNDGGFYSDSNGNMIVTDSNGNMIAWSINDTQICGGETACPSGTCADPDSCSSCELSTGNLTKS